MLHARVASASASAAMAAASSSTAAATGVAAAVAAGMRNVGARPVTRPPPSSLRGVPDKGQHQPPRSRMGGTLAAAGAAGGAGALEGRSSSVWRMPGEATAEAKRGRLFTSEERYSLRQQLLFELM
mmetsp:Transcript_63501/g.182314  ORF Transcript_63501/g.182314 Transcript_63501/m.182314 type:complete len:126 (+) Transcript_63501:53-430(+)